MKSKIVKFNVRDNHHVASYVFFTKNGVWPDGFQNTVDFLDVQEIEKSLSLAWANYFLLSQKGVI